MDIKVALLEEHSKRQALYITQYIDNDPTRFAALMELFLNDEYRVVQRAAWVVGHCADQYLSLLLPYLPNLVDLLVDNTRHPAVRRNIVRILTQVALPEDLMGLAADACFRFLADPKEAPAVRAYAMQVLYNLCLKEPDLAHELVLLIEEALPYGTAAIRSRGNKILKLLKKGRSKAQYLL